MNFITFNKTISHSRALVKWILMRFDELNIEYIQLSLLHI